MIQLGRCLRVKTVGKGATTLDGCQAFFPKPQKPNVCDGCGCHASFHQRLTPSGVPEGGIAAAPVYLTGVPAPVSVPIQPLSGQVPPSQSERAKLPLRRTSSSSSDEERPIAAYAKVRSSRAAAGTGPSSANNGGHTPTQVRSFAAEMAGGGVINSWQYPPPDDPLAKKGKPASPTIAETAAKLGLTLNVNYPDPDPFLSHKTKNKDGRLGIGVAGPVVNEAPMGVFGNIPEWASVVDLTESRADGRKGKKRVAEAEAVGGAFQRNTGVYGEAWMKTALERMTGGGAGAQPNLAAGLGGAVEGTREAPGQQVTEGSSAKRAKKAHGLKKKVGAKVFGDGIHFARKTLAELISGRVMLEKDVTFREVGVGDKDLALLRAGLHAEALTDALDKKASTRKVVAYLAEHARQTGYLQPVGSIRVVRQRPFACEGRPRVQEWLEGKSLGTNIAELSHLVVIDHYRNGAVTLPLFAYVYLKVLKRSGVKYVIMAVKKRLIEKYLIKHLLFLGFEFVDQELTGDSVVVLNLEKSLGLLYGP